MTANNPIFNTEACFEKRSDSEMPDSPVDYGGANKKNMDGTFGNEIGGHHLQRSHHGSKSMVLLKLRKM